MLKETLFTFSFYNTIINFYQIENQPKRREYVKTKQPNCDFNLYIYTVHVEKQKNMVLQTKVVR